LPFDKITHGRYVLTGPARRFSCTINRMRFSGTRRSGELQRLIQLEVMAHGASKDQDNLPMIVVKHPEITDRTLAIFEGGQADRS
jgi:hypothetical protein